MSQDNPYRAAGAFRGKAYIRRDADAQLIEQIEDNQYYPYFAAPRQSGKSSLLLRTMAALPPAKYRSALVDLSPFVVPSYDDFWRQFLHEVARSANFDPTPIATEDPRDVFLLWLRGCQQRLIVFMDEIDVLLNVDCREQIFSKFRTFFNMRARPDTAELERLQFVLAGAAHSSRFIKDPRWSPFNVAIEIELEDLTPAQVSQLSAYLATAGTFAGPDVTTRVFDMTGGSVFLCQLTFEQLWNTSARGTSRLTAADVDAVIDTIVAESPRNIHFFNIFRLVTADARLSMLFRRLTEGKELGHEEMKELRLTGLCRGANPFRNEIYARVFGPGGPLDLKVGTKTIELGKQLDAALARRDRLRDADPGAASAAEAEIRRLRREYREGTALQLGDVLGRGRWRVDEKIGQGGFATVWRAFDGKTQRDVAIKVLHGQFAEDRTRRDRFFRGAWKMSELKHPGIVEVVEPYGEENGYYYFVMEYLRDGTLHDAVLGKKVGATQALKIVAQIGQALEYAHERGLIHRDVKPSNVLVAGESGKLTDFDLVRESGITGGTKSGAMGTFLYAAPEVMSRPQEADVRADIYGLGMTAVFALHGAELAMDVIRDTDRFIERLQCTPPVHEVLKTAVAWDREGRYASAAAFVAALEKAGRVSKRIAVPAAADSQRGPMPEWGAPAGDSVLLGLARPRARPAAPASAVAPKPAAAPPAKTQAAAAAPAAAAKRDLVGVFAAMAAGASSAALDSDDLAVPAPHPDLEGSGRGGPVLERTESAQPSDDAEASASVAPIVFSAPMEMRSIEPAAPGGRRERITVVGLGLGDSDTAMKVAEESVDGDAASKTPERPDSPALARVAGPAAAFTPVRSDSKAGPHAAARGPEPGLSDRMPAARGEDESMRVAGSGEAARATTGAIAAVATDSAVHASQAAVIRPVERPSEPRRLWPGLAIAGLAASVALVFVAIQNQNGDPDLLSEGSAAAEVPGGPQVVENGEVKKDNKRPVTPEAKDTPPMKPPSPTSAGSFASGADVGAAEVEASAGDEEDLAHDETSGPGPEPAETLGLDSGKPTMVATAAGTATTTARVNPTADPSDETAGSEVRPPTKQTGLSFDELVREGCKEASGGNAEKGFKLLIEAHDRNPRNIRLLECLARANMGLNRYEAAERYYRQILVGEPRMPKALLGAAEANEKLGRLPNAASYYDDLRKYFPGNESAASFFRAHPQLDPRGPRGP